MSWKKIGIVFSALFLISLTFVGWVKANGFDRSLRVAVHDSELDLAVRVPVVFVRLGLNVVPDRVLDEVRRELEPHSAAIEVFLDGIDRCDSAELVRIDGADEYVRITVHQGCLRVDVEGDAESICLEVPLAAVDAVWNRIG